MRYTCAEMAGGQRYHDQGGPDRKVRGRCAWMEGKRTVMDEHGEEGEGMGRVSWMICQIIQWQGEDGESAPSAPNQERIHQTISPLPSPSTVRLTIAANAKGRGLLIPSITEQRSHVHK